MEKEKRPQHNRKSLISSPK